MKTCAFGLVACLLNPQSLCCLFSSKDTGNVVSQWELLKTGHPMCFFDKWILLPGSRVRGMDRTAVPAPQATPVSRLFGVCRWRTALSPDASDLGGPKCCGLLSVDLKTNRINKDICARSWGPPTLTWQPALRQTLISWPINNYTQDTR